MSILASGFSLASSTNILPTITGTIVPAHALLAATTLPADPSDTSSATQWIGLGVALALALLVAMGTGVFRPSKVDGPLRITPGRPLWPLAMVIGIAVVIWFGSNMLYFAVKQTIELQHARAAGGDMPASRAVATVHPTIVDFAVLSTVPGILAFAWLFYADRQLAHLSQLRLGFTRARFLDGVAKGLLASVMILPVMFLASALLDAIYTRFHYEHPGEHELLRLMNEARTPFLRWCLIGGAIITAPFFEEYLFRGFLQTLLRQTFVTWTSKLNPPLTGLLAPLPPGYPAVNPSQVELPPPGAPPVLLGYRDAEPPRLPPAQGKHMWQTWAAIAVTSLLFATVHETWTMPLIFLLALFLGYAYERTGSLWTTITIHLVFNTTSTVMYLLQSHGG